MVFVVFFGIDFGIMNLRKVWLFLKLWFRIRSFIIIRKFDSEFYFWFFFKYKGFKFCVRFRSCVFVNILCGIDVCLILRVIV